MTASSDEEDCFFGTNNSNEEEEDEDNMIQGDANDNEWLMMDYSEEKKEDHHMNTEEEAHLLMDSAFLEYLKGSSACTPYPLPGERIEFMLVDIQLRPDKVHGTFVQLFGRSLDGASICALIHGWYPYLYVPAPTGWMDSQANKDCLIMAIQEGLAFALDKEEFYLKRILHQFPNPIVGINLTHATDIMGFDSSKEQLQFLKIQVISPLLIAPLRVWLENKKIGLLPHGAPIFVDHPSGTPTFNSNLDPILQFMVDKNLSGCQWCSVPCVPPSSGTTAPITRCRYEVVCPMDSLQLFSCEERSELGPLRVLSFDLEAAGRRGVFPDPGVDPVIQISIHMFCGHITGEEPFKPRPILLSFKDCDPILDADVLSFPKEESVLLAFRDIVLAFDPDILTGYNICNFDMEYLQKRAHALGIGEEFPLMTRAMPTNHHQKQHQQQSRPMKKKDAETMMKHSMTRAGPEHMQVKEVYFQSAQVDQYCMHILCISLI